MKCITGEMALQILLDAKVLTEENLIHIYKCEKCQDLLRITAEEILGDDVYTAEYIAWCDVFDYLEKKWLSFKVNAKKIPENKFFTGIIKRNFPVPAHMFAAALLPMAANSIAEEDQIVCKLSFGSTSAVPEHLRWTADLLIPNNFSNNAVLSFILKSHQMDISDAELNFSNQKIQIKDGMAKILMKDFRNVIQIPKIYIKYCNGDTADGELVFFEKYS